MDLAAELRALVADFDAHRVPYALCGGLALAVHGRPRATLDIDLLVPRRALEAAKARLRRLGYTHEPPPMRLARGRVEIHRLVKPDPARRDALVADLLPVTPVLAAAWRTRRRVTWEGGRLTVVSRAGLARMKRLRGSTQDRADLEALARGGERE